jgi:hypothetical protein
MSWRYRRPELWAEKLTMCGISWKSGSIKLLEIAGPVQTCTGIALPLPYYASLETSCTLLDFSRNQENLKELKT